jgi:hypothetical protein
VSDQREHLQRSVNRRQDELGELVTALPRTAARLHRRSQLARLILIFAGALIAARGGLAVVWSSEPPQFAVVFSFLGIVVAAVTGMEAAFKWEGRASELRSLAASAKSTLQTADSQWQLGVGAGESEQARMTTLKNIIDLQDRELQLINGAVAKLGITLEGEGQAEPARERYPA